VDITNFLTFDINRPLHVFDVDKLVGDLAVRAARPGEVMLALNGKGYELDSEMTVIADAKGPQSLGGVIGSETSGCTEVTTTVLIEAALFDPVRTAATGRRLVAACKPKRADSGEQQWCSFAGASLIGPGACSGIP